MESFANSCIPKPSSNTRHGTICKGYDESLQLPNGRQMRSNNKEKENKLKVIFLLKVLVMHK